MDIEMVLITCATCNVPFSITKDMQGRLKKCHNGFYCPNGHANYYYCETKEEELRRQLKDERAHSDRLTQEKYDLQEQLKPKKTIKRKSAAKTK